MTGIFLIGCESSGSAFAACFSFFSRFFCSFSLFFCSFCAFFCSFFSAFTSFVLYYGCQVTNDFIGSLPMKLVCWLAADTLNPMEIEEATAFSISVGLPINRRLYIYGAKRNVCINSDFLVFEYFSTQNNTM